MVLKIEINSAFVTKTIGSGRRLDMRQSISVKTAIGKYQSGEFDLDQLEDWALGFPDDPANRLDDRSMQASGYILNLLIELGDGVRTQSEFDADLATLTNTSSAAAD